MADDNDSEMEGREPEEEMDREEGEEPEDERPILNFEAGNMVPDLMANEAGRKLAKELAAKALVERKSALDSSERYRAGIDADWRIFAGELPKKEGRFAKMANMNVPIALENISRLHARMYGEIFGDWQNFHGVSPNRPDMMDVAAVLSKHGNWQFNVQIPDAKRQQSRGLLMFLHQGDVTYNSFYDQRRRCNRHVALTVDEFYVPYASVSVMSDWSDVPYRGRTLRYHRADVERYRGVWHGVDKVLARKPTLDDDQDHDEKILEGMNLIHGIDPPDDGPAPYIIIVHDTWFAFDGDESESEKSDGSGRSRFMRLVVDVSSRTLLSAHVHEAPGWGELARYSRQISEYQQYMQAIEAQNQLGQQQFEIQQRAETGDPENMPTPEELMVLQAPPLEVQRPRWMPPESDAPPDPARDEPIHDYTHAVCIEPLKGVFGIGFGRIVGDLNRVANSATNHHLDASTLENFPPLIASTRANIRKLVIGPGELNHVTLQGNERAQDVVYPLQIARSTGSMMELTKFTTEQARAGMQSPEVLSGERGKSGETARGIETLVGEASKQLSVVARSYADQAVVPILTQNARLNSIHLDEDEVFFVTGEQEAMSVGRSMYQNHLPFHVTLRADMKFLSDAARISQADHAAGLGSASQWLQGNPHYNYQALKQQLEARDLDALIPLLGPPPPPEQMQPFGQSLVDMMAQQKAQQIIEEQVAAGTPGAQQVNAQMSAGGES